MPKHKYRFNSKFKLLMIGCLVATLIIVSKIINLQELLQISVIWVQSLGIWGPIAFILIYNLATLLFIPGSVLTLKGGCLFGLFWGSVYVLIAATTGAILAFIVGRYFSRDWVCQQLEKHPKFQAINQAVAKEGWKIVLLTRLSPIFPFNLLNYAFGVTQVSLKDYILGSIGIIPGTVMYVYMGSLVSNVAMINTSHQLTSPETQIWQWVMQGVGLISTIAVTFYITKIARQVLNKSI
ncbi:TVP38/TMEM64 family protein [Sphaerospermopsis aphanizomenoides BCCUSP55]|uniref:TVP38/TMEM64 family protein n=1 Tax=Sphaerospermopsis aphanizomenoides TaxID=459663 RepID=UPI0019036B05|nr:TVP38/TMEM64 family protein [Sphaerospermopsis aphanizomenoides]MBK1989319.1 TVP38/TMEM64 family protein [Sphaerospermopsis aphanizomenoides BCCUSP55]